MYYTTISDPAQLIGARRIFDKKRCNTKMKMSGSPKIEMSYSKKAIIPLRMSKGGYYGKKGHCQDEYKRDQEVTFNPDAYRK
jgi:hypothetical protein